MRKVIAIGIAALIAVSATGCMGGSSSNSPNIASQSKQAAQSRADAFAKAQAQYPAPNMQNFPLRKALVELTAAQDKINHPWYVYIQAAQTGQVIGYYVAKTAPQSECNTLSNTQSVDTYDNGQGGSTPIILTAPTLNGIYAGGAGASGSCTTVFFQDQATGANIEISGDAYFTTDQPLTLNVPAFKVAR
jgi:hypothetical protein